MVTALADAMPYRHHGRAAGVLAQTGEAVQVERRHRLVLVFREAECLKGELCLLGGSIQVHHRLRIFGTPEKRASRTNSTGVCTGWNIR